jgi:lipopolysaccharide/colanic/teichoic acid biosynthesis glycosyltransferase
MPNRKKYKLQPEEESHESREGGSEASAWQYQEPQARNSQLISLHPQSPPSFRLSMTLPLQEVGASTPGKDYSRLQRIFDCTAAAIALIFTSPVLLAIGILIRLDSPGPALFRQWRVGKDGKLFLFTKFRTLYVDAKERFPDLYAYQYSAEEIKRLQFKISDDPRVTRVGFWLRDSTLDELPNFWNVLTGDMALVGPRPEIPEMLPYYDQEAMVKFSVKPGITGLAQISGRGRLKFLETARCDIQYVRQRSFWFDLKILLTTIYKVIVRDGAF